MLSVIVVTSLGSEWVTPDITEDVVVIDILKEGLYDLQHCIQYLEDLLMAIHNKSNRPIKSVAASTK